MTCAPVADGNIALLNVVSNKGNNTLVNANQSFAKTMNDISNQQREATSEPQQMQNNKDTAVDTNTKKQIQNDTNTKDNGTTKETVSNQKKEEKVENTTTEDETVDAETKDAIKDAAKEILEEIKDKMDVSDEELQAALECLGMQTTDVLDPAKLTDLVVELSQTDLMSLVTDESLYNTLQDLTTSLQDTLEGLMEQFDISEEALKQACMDINAEMSTVDFESLNDNLFTELQQETQNTEEPVITVETEKTNTTENTEQINTNTEDTTDDTIQETHVSHTEKKENQSDMQQNEQQTGFDSYKQQTNENTIADNSTILENTKTPDTENIMRQIMDYMNVKVKEDLTEMEMQLHPASLGTVNLQIATRGGAVTAQFSVQNETVKAALESQVVELKNNLEEQGIKIEAVEVTVASHEFERNLNDQNQNQNEQQEEEQTKVKAARRKIINLNEYESLEEMSEESDDAVRIAMEMMASNGNTLDMLA